MKNYIKPELSVENYLENVAIAADVDDPFNVNTNITTGTGVETEMSTAGWWDLIIG